MTDRQIIMGMSTKDIPFPKTCEKTQFRKPMAHLERAIFNLVFTVVNKIFQYKSPDFRDGARVKFNFDVQ